MAEDKKSFILYTDLLPVVKKLSAEKAGELFLHILRYVNDENPETTDDVIEPLFEIVKQQMKRDLRKYEQKKKQWSDAGKKSAESRAARKNDSQRRSTTFNDVDLRSTVSTVNVNVNDNVILIEKNFEVLTSQQIWIEKVIMGLGIDRKKFDIAINAFKAQNIMAGQVKPITELMDHFSKWYPKAKDGLFNAPATTAPTRKLEKI